MRIFEQLPVLFKCFCAAHCFLSAQCLYLFIIWILLCGLCPGLTSGSEFSAFAEPAFQASVSPVLWGHILL